MNSYTLAENSSRDGIITPCCISVNQTFKNARRFLGLSQREFADLLDIDFVWLSQLENYRLPIPQHHKQILALLPLLAKLAEVDLEWLQSLQMVYRPATGEPPAFVEYLRRQTR